MVNAKMSRKIQELKKRGYGKLAIGREVNNERSAEIYREKKS